MWATLPEFDSMHLSDEWFLILCDRYQWSNFIYTKIADHSVWTLTKYIKTLKNVSYVTVSYVTHFTISSSEGQGLPYVMNFPYEQWIWQDSPSSLQGKNLYVSSSLTHETYKNLVELMILFNARIGEVWKTQ